MQKFQITYEYHLECHHERNAEEVSKKIPQILQSSEGQLPYVWNIFSNDVSYSRKFLSFSKDNKGILVEIVIMTLNSFHLSARCLHYNIVSTQPGEYLIKLNQIILLAMNDQLYNPLMINSYLQQVRQVADEQKKSLKANNYFDLLLYSQLILQNIVRFENRLLLQQNIQVHFEWIYQNSLQELGQMKIKDEKIKATTMFYSIFEYLLEFGNRDKKQSYLLTYLQFLTKIPKTEMKMNEFRFLIAKKGIKQDSFLNKIKKIYSECQDNKLKQTILKMFQQLDRIYQQINHKVDNK